MFAAMVLAALDVVSMPPLKVKKEFVAVSVLLVTSNCCTVGVVSSEVYDVAMSLF